MSERGSISIPRRGKLLGIFAALLALVLIAPRAAVAQETGDEGKKTTPPRAALFEWDTAKGELFVTLRFRDLIDDEIRRKLSRGLPTTIVFTGTLFRRGLRSPVATTVQSCKITWLVWDEVYRLEMTGPEGSRTSASPTLEGVLRRCAEVKRLLVATSRELAVGIAVSLRARLQVNPVSPDVLDKIKMWVSRPARTGTAAPGDALFSTFTGLFMQRISDAERTLDIVTVEAVPTQMGVPVGEG
jgi:hypothetical protein